MKSNGLKGIHVALTGQRKGAEMAEIVRRLGGVPHLAPTVRLRREEARGEAERLVREFLAGADWAVFYTGVGVRAVIETARRMGEEGAFLAGLRRARVLSRGRKALRALREAGRAPDIEAAPGTTEGVASALRAQARAGETVWVQLPGALPPGLREAVEGLGARLRAGAPYRIHAPEDPEAVPRLIGDLTTGRIHAATFTSPPAVHNLFAAADDLGSAEALARALAGPVLTASVGPVTSAALRAHGVAPDLETASQRMGGLLQEVADLLASTPAGREAAP